MDADEEEHRGWYETWLDAIAGERVATMPLFLVWVVICAVLGGGSVALFGGSDQAFFMPVGIVSVVFWFLAVPQWLRHRADSSD